MNDKLPDVWAPRDFPVLKAVAARIDRGENAPYLQQIADDTGLDIDTVSLAGASLKRRGLVEGVGSWGAPVQRFTGVSAEAYFLTGLHPDGDDAVSQLISALRQAAEQSTDPDERSRLRKLADAAGGVSRDVLAGVLTAITTGAIGAGG